MTAYYNILETIKNQLVVDEFVNTVTQGDIFDVDLNKQTIFPLSHIMVNNVTRESNVLRFNVTVMCMDIVDKSKTETTDIFVGNDNEQDVLNTQLAVVSRMLEIFDRGGNVNTFRMDSDPNIEPFTERFENYLAGWSCTFDILVANDMTVCGPLITPAGCSPATINNSDSTYTASVASGGVLALPDSVINVNSVDVGDVVSVKTIDVNVTDGTDPVTPDAVSLVGNTLTIEVPSGGGGVTRSTTTLMRTGKTTIVRTGDDADTRSEGRATDRVTLDAAPIHNDGSATINTTTNRFTDTLGGQTYANDIVLDWSTWNGSTLLGYDKNFVLENNWDDGIDSGLANTVGAFTSGWRLANLNEGMNIFDISLSSRLNYAPFNFNTSTVFMTSTIIGSNYFCIVNITLFGGDFVVKRGLTSNAYTIFVRTFNLSLSNILT